MALALGIDTGGTYTDAVLLDHATGALLASAKALTTHCQLSVGIAAALREVFAAATRQGQALSPVEVDLVGLSTTLATNAIVEDRGALVCLLLIGYDPELVGGLGLSRELATGEVVYLRGGHDGQGDEVVPLDEEGVRQAVLERRHQVEAFAVSGYFGVRNPAHELRARAMVEELSGLPVTCGHELTSRLDSVRRAATAALNARLIPLLRELIATVRLTLDREGIGAPLMIVKGDGSLVQAEWALRRPIETILSGPAASVAGAWHLAGRRDSWVIDVGGTTTDIAVLRQGLPRLSPEGARVGRWRTMIETVDIHTAGLGGDSHVRIDPGTRRLGIGPRRAVPLCQLASEHPQVVEELRRQWADRRDPGLSGQFFLALHRPRTASRAADQELLEGLDSVPRSLRHLAQTHSYGQLIVHRLAELEGLQVVRRSGFTPTDALHVLGSFGRWDREAALLGAQLLAAQFGRPAEAFCAEVVAELSRRLGTELLAKALGDEDCPPGWECEPGAGALLGRSLGRVPESAVECSLALRLPIVAVGAPVQAYLPETARHLRTGLVIPEHAEVANAIGAVVNGVVQRLRVLIQPRGQGYRCHLPGEVCDVADLEEGVARARRAAADHLQSQARQAGTVQTEVQMTREDRTATDAYGGEIYVETELVFTAVGGPGLRSRES
ncbi:MAG: hydantoinase/oxoprolinase family protein [Candidatus Latescibacteria bacterium]|nr:hydantoinase/oxoprolinase family protein [Candidatus Latescibacterota bacterium]